MLSQYEMYEAFKSHQLICSASVFAEATLDMRDKLVFFQVPDQSVIDHTLGYFTETTHECYRAVAAWISFIFADMWTKMSVAAAAGMHV